MALTRIRSGVTVVVGNFFFIFPFPSCPSNLKEHTEAAEAEPTVSSRHKNMEVKNSKWVPPRQKTHGCVGVFVSE